MCRRVELPFFSRLLRFSLKKIVSNTELDFSNYSVAVILIRRFFCWSVMPPKEVHGGSCPILPSDIGRGGGIAIPNRKALFAQGLV